MIAPPLRQFVATGGPSLGALGLLSIPGVASAKHEDTQTILNVAATAEVLATIVNTVGFKKPRRRRSHTTQHQGGRA